MFRVRQAGVLTTLSVMAAAGLITPALASNAPQRKLTPLQRGLSFFHGKTITFIAPTGAGTGSDVDSRAVAQEMSAYLHATINVQNNSSGNGVAGEDALARSNPNGLTIGYFNPNTTYFNLLTNVPGLNFNIEHVTLLGGLPSTPSIIATQTTSSVTSFASLLHAAPSSLKVLGSAGAASDEASLLFATFGIHPTLIFGYNGNNALLTGFLRGDGNIVAISPSPLLPEIAAHAATPIAIMTTNKLPTNQSWDTSLLGTPTVTQLLEKYPPKSARDRKLAAYFDTFASLNDVMFGAPTKVPSDEVLALEAATKFAVHSAYVRQIVIAKGSTWGWISGAVGKANYVSAITHLSAIRTALGLTP